MHKTLINRNSFRFEFVSFEERVAALTPGQDRLYLDAGDELGPGVIDHHHLAAYAGSTTSMVLSHPEFVTGALIIPPYACRLLRYPHLRYLRELMLPAAASAIPGFIVAVGAVTLFPADSLFEIVVQIGIVAALSAFTVFFICLDPPTRATSLRALVSWARPQCQRLVHPFTEGD